MKKRTHHPNPARLWSHELADRLGIGDRTLRNRVREQRLGRRPDFPAARRDLGMTSGPLYFTKADVATYLAGQEPHQERREEPYTQRSEFRLSADGQGGIIIYSPSPDDPKAAGVFNLLASLEC